MSARNTNLSATTKAANGLTAPLLLLEGFSFEVETFQGPQKTIVLHRRGTCVFVCNADCLLFYCSLEENSSLLLSSSSPSQGWQSQAGLAVPARAGSPNQGRQSQLGTLPAPEELLLPAQLCPLLTSQPVLAGVLVTIVLISCSHSQGRGSNVIHCRKDGTWSGSFHLCREMQGQCTLPTQLNSHLKLQCAGGYGIGVWASAWASAVGVQLGWKWGAVGQEMRKRIGMRGRREDACSP